MTVKKPKNIVPDTLGRELRRHRKAAGLTQKELAFLAGVGKTAVFDLEKGKATVQLATLFKVLTALNLRPHLRSPLVDQEMIEL